MPGNDITETSNPGNNANYFKGYYVIGSPYYRTVAGEFELSASPYGTFDQGGNVVEWNETAVTSSSRGLRGGAGGTSALYLTASYSTPQDPASRRNAVGFRVASIAVPEPYGAVLLAVAAIGALLRRGR